MERQDSERAWPDRAVVVVHGIGEQRRGATLEALVRALRRNGASVPEPVEERAPFATPLPQEALRVSRAGVVADVYEVYWAPLTARKTTARAVLWWLLRATFIQGSRMTRPSRKTLWDAITAVVAVTLVTALLLFAVMSVGNLSAQVSLCHPEKNAAQAQPPLAGCELAPEQRNVAGESVTAGWHRQVAAVFGSIKASLAIQDRPFGDLSPSHAGKVLELIPVRSWFYMMLVAFLFAQLVFRLAQITQAVVQGRSRLRHNNIRRQLVLLAILGISLFVAMQVLAPVLIAFIVVLVVTTGVLRVGRTFLAESLGDVQVYAERDENNEHYAAREAVLAEAEKTFALVSARDYREIVVLGHSLGSVIAFTALDRLRRRVPELLPRIQAFVTFGSALEKVRFFFERRKHADETAGARLVRPAHEIAGDRVWLNLWYENDVVANPITTFDSESSSHKDYRFRDLPPFADLIDEARRHLVVNISFGYPITRLPLVWTHSRYWGDASVTKLITDLALGPERNPPVAAER